jgi:hypothetical protein
MISLHVLSAQIKLTIIIAKIAAAHHAGSGTRPLTAAFGPAATISHPSADRSF